MKHLLIWRGPGHYREKNLTDEWSTWDRVQDPWHYDGLTPWTYPILSEWDQVLDLTQKPPRFLHRNEKRITHEENDHEPA